MGTTLCQTNQIEDMAAWINHRLQLLSSTTIGHGRL
jgi:hypothetical protein